MVSVSTLSYTPVMGEHLETPAFVALYRLLQVQGHVLEPISRELEARTGLSASWYELLACLQHAPEGCRMNEIADDLLISRGGATKLVARLEDAGLVERATPKTDRRATYATITPAGTEAVMAAHPVQLELVDEYFGRFLEPAELSALTAISKKVLNGLGAHCSWLDEAESGATAPAPENAVG